MSRIYPTPTQQANKYFARLKERERKQKAKAFHSYILTKNCGQVCDVKLLEIFNEYCNTILKDRPGPTCMTFNSYVFLLIKLSALEERTSLGKKGYTILPWPKEVSLMGQFKRHVPAHRFQATRMPTATQWLNESSSLAQTITSLPHRL